MPDVGNQNIIGIDGMEIYFAEDLGFEFFDTFIITSGNKDEVWGLRYEV
jgi:hypothetical protein